MLRLGAANAINLDGGGSAAAAVRDNLVTQPSDRCAGDNPDTAVVTCPRRVSSIVCLRERPPPLPLNASVYRFDSGPVRLTVHAPWSELHPVALLRGVAGRMRWPEARLVPLSVAVATPATTHVHVRVRGASEVGAAASGAALIAAFSAGGRAGGYAVVDARWVHDTQNVLLLLAGLAVLVAAMGGSVCQALVCPNPRG